MQIFTFLTGSRTVFQATVGNLEDSSLHWESVPWAILQYTDSQLEAHQRVMKWFVQLTDWEVCLSSKFFRSSFFSPLPLPIFSFFFLMTQSSAYKPQVSVLYSTRHSDAGKQ